MATPQSRITSSNRYRVEIDGFPVIYATNADIPEKRANLHTHQAGNQRNPEYGPSTYTVGEFTFRHATAKGNIDVLLDDWFNRVHRLGIDDKRNARVVIYDHSGRTPLRTWALRNCCPSNIKAGDHAGDSNDTSDFSFSLQPEDADLL